MIKSILYIVVLFIGFSANSQGESTYPLAVNPQLYKHNHSENNAKLNAGTFDSTFIYTADTLQLPFFDDFSKNNFQVYNYGFSDPGVTSVLEYRLLDDIGNPIPVNEYYTQQVTFRRIFNVAQGTFTDQPLTPIPMQLGDQTNYPTTYQTISAYPPYRIYDTVDYPNDPDTIWLTNPELFQETARQFFVTLNDKNAYWLDQEAYHNYSFAVEPWTLGVATFDGLDENGYPYAIGTTTTNYADHLTSKPIDLSGLSPADSVYMSFLFQSQGFSDVPESGDSLILEFYNKGTDTWDEIWRGGGTTVQDFDFAHLRVDDPQYFNDYFQFRFVNYGGLSGLLDVYNLDYVHLRALSGYQDTLFKDFAVVYPLTTLLNDYTSVPWDHYKANFNGKMSDNVQVAVRNGSNLPENNSVAGEVEVSYAGVPEGSFVLPGSDLANGDLNYAPRTTYTSFHDFSSGYHFDETKTGDRQEFDLRLVATAQYPNFNGNDTSYSKQVFENYYSYDDGSAELAYGPTGIQSRLAIKYTPYQADSLVGIMINFIPHNNDVTNKLFTLAVWGDNNGVPSDVPLYEDDPFFPRQPDYTTTRDGFGYYLFHDSVKVFVDGTFYVGWRQFDSDRLHVGLDANIVNNDKTFYSNDGGATWNQSSIPGSVMIRPIFSTNLDYTLGVETVEKDWKLYPNPSSDFVMIEGDNYNGVEVYNLQGQLVLSSTEPRVDISHFKPGMYLFRPIGSEKVYKIIKQ